MLEFRIEGHRGSVSYSLRFGVDTSEADPSFYSVVPHHASRLFSSSNHHRRCIFALLGGDHSAGTKKLIRYGHCFYSSVLVRSSFAHYRRADGCLVGDILVGLSQLLSSFFSALSFVPLSYTAGFILTTRIKDHFSFLFGSTIVILCSFFPILLVYISSIPVPVAYAAVFFSFVQMLGFGLKVYGSAPLQERSVVIIGISLMIGFGSMSLPQTSLSTIPPGLAIFMGNGLAMGVAVCILLEQGQRLLERKKAAEISPPAEKLGDSL